MNLLIPICVIVSLLLVIGVLMFVIIKFSRTLLTFDDLFEILCDDIDTNIIHFEKLETTPIFSNSPEIVTASQNMKIMKIRLEEFLKRIGEVRGKKKVRKTLVQNPPVVR